MIEKLGRAVQAARPELVPREPYTYTPPAHPAPAPPAPADKKGKAAPKAPAPAPAPAPADSGRPNARVPQAPVPAQLSPYSPTRPTGMLVDAVKAGMAAEASAAQAAAPPPGSPAAQIAAAQAAAGKGKRKIVRVRA
jgi:hypothetical protein